MSTASPDVAILDRLLPDESATRALGADLARSVTPPVAILLDGPLGAGKTTFVQGFAAALDAHGAASPSFVVAHYYAGARMPIWHLDLYRVEDSAEIEDLDLDAYLPTDGATLVEWAARAPEAWPRDRIEVAIAIAGSGRRAVLTGRGRCASAVRRLAGVTAGGA